MRYRLRTLLIVLAGLALLECCLPLLEDLNLPGGMLTWAILIGLFHYVVPIAFAATLVAIFILLDPAKPT